MLHTHLRPQPPPHKSFALISGRHFVRGFPTHSSLLFSTTGDHARCLYSGSTCSKIDWAVFSETIHEFPGVLQTNVGYERVNVG
jgi:hypothetical protein